MKFCKTVYIHVMLYQNKAFKMTVSGLNNAAMVLSKLTVLSIVSIVIFILQPLQRFVNKTLLYYEITFVRPSLASQNIKIIIQSMKYFECRPQR